MFEIYMKSGNVIKIRSDKLTWKETDSGITFLTWTKSEFPRLCYIDINNIEAIVSIE